MQRLFPEVENGKKNTRTFFFGSILHWLFYVFLNTVSTTIPSMLVFKNFYYIFWMIDAITMAIIYKTYYNRSIMNELDDYADKKWVYNNKNDNYEHKNDVVENKIAENSVVENDTKTLENVNNTEKV